jgi:hypothetical protein
LPELINTECGTANSIDPTAVERAGSDAVDMTSITPATDKNLRAAASAQKHSARNFIDTCGSLPPTIGL